MTTPAMHGHSAADPASDGLPQVRYPMVTRMISHPLIQENNQPAIFAIKGPHPIVPEMTIVRMFVNEYGVEVYSRREDKAMRSFVPFGWIRLVEEAMPFGIFAGELKDTDELPALTCVISNGLLSQDGKADLATWAFGGTHPLVSSMRIVRMVIDRDCVAVYSMLDGGKSGMRNLVPIQWVRIVEEAFTSFSDMVDEIVRAESEDGEDDPVPNEASSPLSTAASAGQTDL